MENSQIYIDYNFLPSVNHIYNLIKKEIPLYSFSKHPDLKESIENNESWPGKRSAKLNEVQHFLEFFILETAIHKFKINRNRYSHASSYVHVRLDEDNKKDFIHQDTGVDTLLVYLSPTNINSGTVFYADDKKTPITDVSFIQNTAVMFDGSIYHCSKNNFGQDVNDGRMTLNLFLRKK